jgi:gliding motility-associated-like protein
MKFFTKSLQVLLLIVFIQQVGVSQTCPSINAQVTTGASTTICSGQCANLTASVVATKATSTYSVGSVAYSPFAYTGGTTLPSVDDVWSDSINIGFNFCYFGNTYNKLVIGSNGEINFNKSLANTFNNYNISTTLPNTIDLPGNSICGVFKDIDLSAGGVARTYITGTAPCRKFVAYWSNVPLYQSSTDNCGTILNTFQIVLYETTNQVEIYVASTAPCALGGNTDRGLIGIQNLLGTTAVAPPSRNTLSAWTANNEGWRFNPTGANTFTVSWSGPNSFTATGLTAAPCPTATSTYTATMNIADCAGSITSFSSSVQVSVTPVPSITAVSNPSILCRGSSASITASGATSYTWLPGGSVTSSITVSPTVTTTYTISGANGTCTSSATFTLPVSALPTITAASNPTVICSGTGSATLTGGGGTTYTWNPGGLIGSPVIVSPVVATQYTLTGSNAAGCIRTRTVNVNVSLSPTVTASASSPTACAGSTITLTSSGASTYTWTPGNLVGATVVATPMANTTYTVRGRNAGGCIGTETVNVTVSPGITFSVSATPSVICRGNSSTLTATGATSYTWTPGILTNSVIVVSPTVTTIYTVTGSSGGSCSATKTIAVTISIPNIVATKTPTAICIGNSGTLTATGGVTYTWSPGALTGNTIVVNPTSTTLYTVTGTNALGCTNTRTISLPVLANPTVNIAATNASLCPGFSTTLTASGGTSYTWSPGSFTTTNIAITPTVSGTYSVIGRNASGCTTTNTIDITVFPSVTLSPVASPSIICRGNSSTLTASGATSYTWNPGALTGSNVAVSPSVSIIYTVSGTSSNGCVGTNTLSVNVSTLSVTATSNPTILCSSSTATLTGTGATTYTWNPGGITGNTIVVTPPSTTIYTVTGTNTLGCTATRTLNLSVGITPTISANASSLTVCAAASITLSSSGGTSYTWTPGAITGASVVVNPIVSTTYTVRGANASGCSSTNTVAITVNPNPSVTVNANPTVLCPTFSSTLSASGTAVSYMWNPGAISNSSIVVTPSTTTVYTVVGTSSLGCTTSATVNLKVNPSPTVSATASQTSICAGATTTLSANGAFSYTWNPGALTGSVVAVSPSVTTTYTLTGNNGLGCIDNSTISINVNALPSLSITTSSTTVCSASSVTLTATGGTTYTWSPIVSNTASVIDNPTVTTTYTVSSDNSMGCVGTQTATINVVTYPTLTLSASSNTICSGNNATLTATGATSYTWNPGTLTTASVVVTPTVTTTYTVDGTNGTCSTTQTITLAVSPNLTVTASATSTTICSGNTTTLTGSGATSYTWNPGTLTGTNVAVTPTVTTTYTVDGDNGSGCIGSNTITINVNSAPLLSIAATSTVLCSAGSVTLTASGGTTYTWSPVTATTASVVDSPTTTTTYTVSSDNGTGCIATQTITVNVGSNPTLTVSASFNSICLGNSSTLSANGASTYTWNPGALTGSTTAVSPTVTTTYTVTGDNGFGCINTETITISVGPALSLTTSASSNTICAGSSATLTGSGATSYTWNPGAIISSTTVVSPSVTTTYTVDADNGTGCIASETITINVNAIPSISITATSTLLCSSGSVTMTASGATSYTWMPLAALTASVTDSPTITTTYTVTGADAIGCSSSQTITISVGTTPTVSASSPSTTICAGLSATLTGAGATSYTWNPGALTGTTTVVTPSVTTTYTVDGDNGTGCVGSNTITINVNSAPSLSVSATSTLLCSAGSITLTASGGTTYTWSPVTATTASVVDSPTITTTYTVSSDNGTGCVASETITINVGTSPSITITASPIGTICVGTTATLTANGAASYTWNPTGATTNSIMDAPTITTTYTITGDNGFGCTSTNTFVLDVAPGTSITAVANPIAACANSTFTLSGSGATTYTWMPMNISGTSVTVTPSISTTYTVLGDNGACIATTTVIANVTPGPANVTATVSGDITCLTSTVNLFGNTTSSPVVYLWTGPSSYTSNIQNPTGIALDGTYTLTVTDGLTSCSTQTTVTVLSNTTIPNLTALASGSLGCVSTVTLTAASTSTNTLTYLWNGPLSFTASVQSPTTNAVGDYTVNASDAITGCSTTATITVGSSTVTPSFTATISGSLTCIGNVTLTATPTSTDPVTYSWTGPTSFTSSIQSPTTSIAGDYTISVTDMGSGCSSTSTITVGTNTVGPNLTAITSGSLGCATSVTLTASTAGTNTLTYLWSGPSSFTSTVQSPTATVAGDYTVTVNDALTGCNSTATITVGTNTTIPSVGIGVPTPVLGCNTTVTLSVITAITPTMSFAWSGPLSFTSTAQTPTTSVAGDYTVTVTDPTNGCSNTIIIPVTTNTIVPVISATVIPTTCSGTVANNDATIMISGYGATDTYDMSQAATYTGTSTYVTGSAIPFGGTLTNTLTNPATSIPYTIRVFSLNGCFADVTLTLTPTTCTSSTIGNVLGMTKAVSTPTLINNNAYNVTYTLVAVNASTVDLTGFIIGESLDNAFPLPTTYSVISQPVITSLNSSLTINPGFNGTSDLQITNPLTSTLTAGKKDTIVFIVQINPNGFFGPFINSVTGFGVETGTGTFQADSSNIGFAWDPDGDGDPTNNNTPTPISLSPNTQIGVAKSGTVSEILADKTLDVTYVITVKNLGNDTLKSVQAFDTLLIPTPATFTIKSGPTSTGSLTANGSYNGTSDIALLVASASTLAPGESQTITFVLNITPNEVRSITNIAIGNGVGSTGGTVRDSSNTGTEADPNGNGVATEPGENIPTVVALPDVNLFIPEVFTPDGDGKNDFFVIKGIEGRTVNLTVFNRWGNKVYQNDAYDNTWSGTPNVSGLIIGNSKLPQGTYYYVIDFEDGADEPTNGYVVLQY